ncbi:rare lipoprotein A [Escherichia coli]|uniref:Rare lipoprotein A n=1 Tax=Escherichia coli TaxID=562 RepID=A0A376MTZ3_ECOLX|nr:rare lipoprotein A [Escherichia coli]
MIVVRINDRGPYGNDRVISLSRAAADRLNTSNNTKVRIDPIIVARMVRFLVLVWLVPQLPNRLTPCLHLPI